MLKAAVLLSVCTALPALASPIVRVADVNIQGSSYKVEVSIENQSVGRLTSVTSTLRSPDTPDDGPAYCTGATYFSGATVVFKLKSRSGAELARVAQAAELQHLDQSGVRADGSCQTASVLGSTTNFFHADDFVNFNVNGQVLSVSLVFGGSMAVSRDGAYQASVDANSMQQLRYFVNNQNGLRAQLVDPAAPPAPAYENPDDI